MKLKQNSFQNSLEQGIGQFFPCTIANRAAAWRQNARSVETISAQSCPWVYFHRPNPTQPNPRVNRTHGQLCLCLDSSCVMLTTIKNVLQNHAPCLYGRPLL